MLFIRWVQLTINIVESGKACYNCKGKLSKLRYETSTLE